MKLNLFQNFRRSFQVKVITVSIIFMLLTCITLTIYYVRIQHESLNEALIARAQLLAGTLAHSAKVGIYSENINLLKDPIGGVAEHEEVLRVAVFNSLGRLLAQKQKPLVTLTMPSNPATEKIINSVLLDRLRHSMSPIFFSNRDALQIWSTVFSSTGYTKEEALFFDYERPRVKTSVIGFVNIVLSKEMTNKQIYGFIHKAILLALATILAGSLVIYYFIKGITRPLQRLTEGIKALGSEGITKTIPVDTKDEIGKLAMAFNDMGAALRETVRREIETANDLAHAKNLAVLGVTASKITHEVGNLLNNVDMSAHILKNEILTPEGKKALSRMEKESARVKTFIQNFLKFAKPPEVKPAPVALDLIIREVLAMHEGAANKQNIAFKLDWPREAPKILADDQIIYQVFNNLINNSIQAMEGGGIVRVSGELHNGYLGIAIEDNGPGIPPEHLDRIFEPFFTTKGKKGTGLGMAIVQSMIIAHRGTINCRSEQGKGTEIYIQLPLQ